MVILEKTVAGLTESALARFVNRACRIAGLRGSLDVLITGSMGIRSLNRRFRGRDKATDVLSFPALASGFHGYRRFVGDIAISSDIAAENAARFGHSASEEVKILALHGILHLAGFDHESDNGAMARQEAHLRQLLRLPPALTERVPSGDSRPAKTKERKRHRARAAL